ncbi:MAG TPA: RNA polymerase sigma factor [Bacteroidales bacterium]|nr:RNA polymerase sigma factor [Bacteroidales bacterium]
MDTKELICRCQKWQKKAQNELYDSYAPRLYAVCMRYMADRDDAKDVLQESLIKIFKNIGSFTHTEEKAFYAWMIRITVNTALNAIRSNTKFKMNTDIEEIENNPADNKNEDFSVYDEIIECIGSPKLFDLIKDLPDGYRTVFNLYVVENFSHKEISEQLDISVNTSKTQLFKARKMLLSKLNQIIDHKILLKEVV